MRLLTAGLLVRVQPGEPAHFTGNCNQPASNAPTNSRAVREMSHPGSQLLKRIPCNGFRGRVREGSREAWLDLYRGALRHPLRTSLKTSFLAWRNRAKASSSMPRTPRTGSRPDALLLFAGDLPFRDSDFRSRRLNAFVQILNVRVGGYQSRIQFAQDQIDA